MARRSTVKPVPATPDSLDELIASHAGLRRLVESMASTQTAWDAERVWLRALIDQVPDYLFVKDRDCRFIVANKAVAADLGHGDPNALLGKTDYDLHPPHLAEDFFADDSRVIRTGVPLLDHEEFVLRPDGSKRWLSTSKLPLRSPAGDILGMVGVSRDITERRLAEERIHHLAFHDALTGLPNRMLFEQKLQTALLVATRTQDVLIILIDLDRFKHVNDTLGHAAGDELLKLVGERLASLVGNRGLVARLGGDEFGVLLTHVADFQLGKELSTAIIAELSKPFELFGDEAFIGASLGLTRGQGCGDSDRVLREADTALYQAKTKGRSRWQIFLPEMASVMAERREIEHDLREALDRGDQLLLEYQPIFAGTGELVGAEALVRWQHPTRGRLAPDLFIGVAEERGLIDRLGEWVFRQACRTLADHDIPWIAVNASPVQLRRPHFADWMLDTIDEMGLKPHRLQLEITESVLLDASGAVEGPLNRLREAGMSIALDDFGTGYSSLGYLRRYRLDKLKVDRSFVAELGESEEAGAIVRAIVAMARAMGMRVTAEGVETEAQRRVLLRCGCDELQGYLLSRPVPLNELKALSQRQEAARHDRPRPD